MSITIVIEQMLELFAMMLTGYLFWKKEWMDESGYQKLSAIVVNLLNPLLMLSGILGQSVEGESEFLKINLILTLLYYAILICLGVLIVWILRPEKSQRKIYQLMSIFPNVGFMGIPVITGIYGKNSMICIIFYMLGYNLLLYTFGIYLAKKAGMEAETAGAVETIAGTGTKKEVPTDRIDKTKREQNGQKEKNTGEQATWKRMLNPGVITSVLAIILFIFQISVPTVVEGFCDYMGNATIPLSMMLIGMSIAKADLKKIFSNGRIYLFVLIKMVILPVSAAFLLRRLPLNSMVAGVFVLQLAMPVGSIVTLIAEENGADETCCTNGIVLSTLASIVTIPLVGLFLR